MKTPQNKNATANALWDSRTHVGKSLIVARGIKERYQVLLHDSKSNVDLQIADYCNWAIYRKWSRGDERSYNLIRTAIRSEFDIFRSGSTYYY